MNSESVKKNAAVLLSCLTQMVKHRFKTMAKEEVLSRFLGTSIDPAVLMDLQLQVERESVQLTELSLLELVTAGRLEAEILKASERIQSSYGAIFEQDAPVEFASKHLVHQRARCFRTRVDLFNPFLTNTKLVDDCYRLAQVAFVEQDRFIKKIKSVLDADRSYDEALIKEASSMHRFMLTKQTRYTQELAEQFWVDFGGRSFRKTPELR